MRYFIFLIKFTLGIFFSFFLIYPLCLNLFRAIGVNKTVEWSWDLSGFLLPLLLVYIAIYLTLFLLKVNLNRKLTISSLQLLLICFFTVNITSTVFIISLLSINIIYSIYLKL